MDVRRRCGAREESNRAEQQSALRCCAAATDLLERIYYTQGHTNGHAWAACLLLAVSRGHVERVVQSVVDAFHIRLHTPRAAVAMVSRLPGWSSPHYASLRVTAGRWGTNECVLALPRGACAVQLGTPSKPYKG